MAWRKRAWSVFASQRRIRSLLTREVIELYGSLGNLMPSLHLPVQSGSDAILKAMNRRYTAEHYLGLIEEVRKVNPDISLLTDIIVGFPGETEEDFQATYDLVERVGYSQVFTFIYSRREGTPAASMQDDTPHEVIQRRFDSLVDLVQENAFAQNQRFVEEPSTCLWRVLRNAMSAFWPVIARTISPCMRRFPKGCVSTDIVGTVVPVRIDAAKAWYLSGAMLRD